MGNFLYIQIYCENVILSIFSLFLFQIIQEPWTKGLKIMLSNIFTFTSDWNTLLGCLIVIYIWACTKPGSWFLLKNCLFYTQALLKILFFLKTLFFWDRESYRELSREPDVGRVGLHPQIMIWAEDTLNQLSHPVSLC